MRAGLLLLAVAVTVAAVAVDGGAGGRRRALYAQYDALFVARCDARCFNHRTGKNQCVKACLAAGASKPGACPAAAAARPVFASACLDACSLDSQCPDVHKCCRHQCGVTCQAPDGLDTVPGLPRVPSDVTVSERRRGRTPVVRWRGEPEATAHGVLYVLEERHHVGRHFSEGRMGAWTARHRSARTSVLLRHGVVKPGRWYQFRVAAVNENGTRGYSHHSARFITSLGPRPPGAPTNMTVGALRTHADGTVHGELRWEPPASDLPVHRYRVYWSRRLHGAIALNSVLVHHQTVAKDQTKFELKNLQPNSQYFLQVQALAQFGRERLKGEKSATVLNTTVFSNGSGVESPVSAPAPAPSQTDTAPRAARVEGLHVQRVYWSRDGLHARVSWTAPGHAASRYAVSWSKGPCQNYGKEGPTYLQLSATTKVSHFDIYGLEFRCRYRVGVRQLASAPSEEGRRAAPEAAVTFTTPSCAQLASRTQQRDKPDCARHQT